MTAVRRLSAVVLLTMVAASASAQDLRTFEKRTTVRTFDNGLTVIIYERPEVPVFSYATVVNTGSAQEVPGITGLAHMFEHMAFKGNDVVGTRDWAAEQEALRKVEEAYAAYDRERRRETGRNDERLKELEQAWRDAIAEADKFVVTDEFQKVVESAGGVGLNA
ncbi:MAG TPA: insulinase family protein, partial [Thermoanaerobaculia bacterium]|nr:insulinase family protein [Thermoanaerobaculia bacterium]